MLTERRTFAFVENAGQFDERARFQVRGATGTVWLAGDAIWITLLDRRANAASPAVPMTNDEYPLSAWARSSLLENRTKRASGKAVKR